MEFINYFLVIYIFMMSPGPSMALISRNSAKFGVAKTTFTIFGILTSITFYTILSLIGIGALINLYPNAFKMFKLLGSCYIIYVGLKIFYSTFKAPIATKKAKQQRETKFQEYITGLLTDLSNPLTVVGLTSIILSFINISDSIEVKFIYLALTVISGFCYAYSYAFLFGNPIAKKFIEPKLILFERIAGMLVAIVGCIFIFKTLL